MAFGDSQYDATLRDAWHRFCEQMKPAGDLVFKDANPANSLQRADGFRFITQALGQAFDLAWRPRTPLSNAPRILCPEPETGR